MMIENGVVSWEYLTVAHGISRMRSAVKVMTEEISIGIRDFAILGSSKWAARHHA